MSVAVAGACPELRFSIVGDTLARADAVKTYLLGAGVAAEKIVKTEGNFYGPFGLDAT